jgi:lipopolysaccharide/colanic/teichoic acid biosynthesis glycosyltransferase
MKRVCTAMLHAEDSPSRAPDRAGRHKAVFDLVFAATALALLMPMMAVISLAIKLSSPGPVLFRQRRHGLHGEPFTILKFRTMHVTADVSREALLGLNEAPGPVFNIQQDPRVIPGIGRFLRRSNLDELPQLINVLRGEMSIVGPRPHETFVVDQYEPWQRERLRIKPGLTCTWQTERNRHQVPFEKWMQMDIEYVTHHSLRGDVPIIAKTLAVLVHSVWR